MNTRHATAEGGGHAIAQALPGDGEHQKTNPERNRNVNGPPRQPPQISEKPADCSERERQREQRALTAEKRDADSGHYGAAHHDEDRSGRERRAEDSRCGAQTSQQRSEITPAPRQRHGAFEADHGAKESAGHERPVQRGQFRDGRRERPAQSRQSRRHPQKQRCKCEHQQGHSPCDRNVGNHSPRHGARHNDFKRTWRYILSILRIQFPYFGFSAASRRFALRSPTSCQGSTAVPNQRDFDRHAFRQRGTMALCAFSVMRSPMGQAGVVMVSSTRTRSGAMSMR